ncbi:MAG: hypothetical protein P1Q69_05215 [Candidatus Thorarchaeota archaeon]|nr:hypothetical protein [Candidatus Thorarchaeota archaeon]
MRKIHLLLLVLLLSLTFNVGFIIYHVSEVSDNASWMFPELGPAVIQDSYYGRAPGLESPIGLIGDIPGLYSMYRGNPLQAGAWNIPGVSPNGEIVAMAIAFALIPIIIVVALGRRSYGSSKTQ